MLQTIDRLTQNAPLLLALASAAILGTAYFFQYGLGYQPCDLCYLQRQPYYAVVGLGLIATAIQSQNQKVALWLLGITVLALIYNAGLAGYHVGVEQKWWLGPTGCSAGGVGTGSVDDLLSQLGSQRVVRCDEPAWTLFGISMAGYNIALSGGLALFGARALWLSRRKAIGHG